MADTHTTRPAERWKPVAGYELFYEVSDLGRVRAFARTSTFIRLGVPFARTRRPRDMRPIKSNPHGHLKVGLCGKSGKQSFHLIHRLVLEAFVGPCPPAHECCHTNGNPGDNRLVNLRWGTHRENGADMVRHGRTLRGKGKPNAVLSEEQVAFIRRNCSPRHKTLGRAALARRFGVTRTAIYLALRGKNWAWLS